MSKKADEAASVSVRVSARELAAWRRATTAASDTLGTRLTLSQWMRSVLNDAVRKKDAAR